MNVKESSESGKCTCSMEICAHVLQGGQRLSTQTVVWPGGTVISKLKDDPYAYVRTPAAWRSIGVRARLMALSP